ncbi:C40 family peptidase [Streptomyces yaizuensis]|uniref:NlpC/P60 family protein n=1 Tax=Streptomyces yaizuensis TaxID=2989713 RepID=A0ABQ5P6U2_9ACTN|nr:peptidase M23 [Streptomyces sp. YSPA8]GLF98279.1 NlpC/P60 family protein [Streptomyces sp. YSPA8]
MDQRDIARVAMQTTGVVKKGAQAKFAVIGVALFVAGLLLMGLLFPAGKASAVACSDTGPGTDDSTPVSDTGGGQASGSLRQKQIGFAKDIDSVAVRLKLPGRATLVALMTAMQESTLQNLDYGDRDSVGLFQQRPSMNWGTRAQIMTPAFASESFFLGRGGNPGLVDIGSWQLKPLGEAAQAVQKSAHPGLYAGHENAMRTLAKDAGINLERAGTTGPAGDDAAGDSEVTSENNCDAPAPVPGKGGGKFSDGKQTYTLNNPRTVEAAIAWAEANAGSRSTRDWYQRCLAYTAIVYGWSYSGVNYAIDHYTVVPKEMRHDKDRNPPPGALMYWDTGRRAGHIAVYLGDNKVASNDILRPGYIDIVDAELFETKWGATYIGWTPPVFPKAG